jgi:hypothetical protein
MSQLALAERYRELGFRVIEGGKSGKLVVLKSPALAWALNVRHDNQLLRKLRALRQKINTDLSLSFDLHVRPSTYRDGQRREQDCFELTQTGILIAGAAYDPNLLLLLALLFDAVTSDEAEADSIIGQIKARLKEIRGKADQAELDLAFELAPAPQQEPPKRCAPAIELRPGPPIDLDARILAFEAARPNNFIGSAADNAADDDPAGNVSRNMTKAPMHSTATTEKRDRSEKWQESVDGVSYDVLLRYCEDNPQVLRIWQTEEIKSNYRFFSRCDDKQLLVCVGRCVPPNVIKLALDKTPGKWDCPPIISRD